MREPFVSTVDRPFAPPLSIGEPLVTFDLPFPPSLNNLFVNVPKKGRVPSKPYQQWKLEAGWRLITTKPRKLHGPVWITLQFEEKKGRRDLDNLAKAVLDLCVTHKVIDGDDHNTVRGLMLLWDGAVTGCRVHLSQLDGVGA